MVDKIVGGMGRIIRDDSEVISFIIREKDVQEHLRSVYGTLVLGLMAAIIGSWLHLFIDFLRNNFFLLFSPILLMMALMKTPHTVHNEHKRLGFFIAFCTLSGMCLGPVIEKALIVDPSIILTAFLATAIVFGCFTMAALHAPSTKFLHLGGFITSGLLFIMITAVFSHSAFMHTTCLWLAFVINCALVLYDTQLICEKRRCGDTDYILHTIELFIDFINLFRYVLTALSEKKERGDRKRND
ncbi:Bax inhibitor [Dirofilaria immitis]